ncbi:MAG: D-cysteine desulfhydrase family protein [Granulosicoccaceae bacterium]
MHGVPLQHPRAPLFSGETPLELMPRLSRTIGGAQLWVKRDDLTQLAFGGNKVRQLEYYFGQALLQQADTVLITGAVQSNFVRLAAAAANKLSMTCHIQLEHRVNSQDTLYYNNGNVLLDRLLGATLHHYPRGEDEAGADAELHRIAAKLTRQGRKPYVIPLAPGHPPYGALGYVRAAEELQSQMQTRHLKFELICVASGSGATHAGLLFGLRKLGNQTPVLGICVRRQAALQTPRIIERCQELAELLQMANPVADTDVMLDDQHLAPGYGLSNPSSNEAILLAAQLESLILDPTYTAKTLAGALAQARALPSKKRVLFIHTGGTPAVFAYQRAIEYALRPQ